jgi:hypothetical protein
MTTQKKKYLSALSEYRTSLETEAALAGKHLRGLLETRSQRTGKPPSTAVVIRLDHHFWMEFDEQCFGAVPVAVLDHFLENEVPECTLEQRRGFTYQTLEWVGWGENEGGQVSYIRIRVSR